MQIQWGCGVVVSVDRSAAAMIVFEDRLEGFCSGFVCVAFPLGSLLDCVGISCLFVFQKVWTFLSITKK